MNYPALSGEVSIVALWFWHDYIPLVSRETICQIWRLYVQYIYWQLSNLSWDFFFPLKSPITFKHTKLSEIFEMW